MCRHSLRSTPSVDERGGGLMLPTLVCVYTEHVLYRCLHLSALAFILLHSLFATCRCVFAPLQLLHHHFWHLSCLTSTKLFWLYFPFLNSCPTSLIYLLISLHVHHISSTAPPSLLSLPPPLRLSGRVWRCVAVR